MWVRKGRNLKRLKALANSILMSSKEERGNAQNADSSRGLEEGIGSKLLNSIIYPQTSSDSRPLVLIKRLCLIQEGMEERGGNQLSLHLALFFYIGYTPVSLTYEGRRKDSWCLSPITSCGSHHPKLAGGFFLVCLRFCLEENLSCVPCHFALTSTDCSLMMMCLWSLRSFCEAAAA